MAALRLDYTITQSRRRSCVCHRWPNVMEQTTDNNPVICSRGVGRENYLYRRGVIMISEVLG